jgi:hypothetical protein
LNTRKLGITRLIVEWINDNVLGDVRTGRILLLVKFRITFCLDEIHLSYSDKFEMAVGIERRCASTRNIRHLKSAQQSNGKFTDSLGKAVEKYLLVIEEVEQYKII